jgi:ubiquinone biosynthesis protein COQ4
MDDFSRLGVNEVSTGNSTLVSSSKYLNDPRLRDAMATAILRRNGRERRVGWDSTPIVRAYRELRDPGAINALIAAERQRNPELDAWFAARHISTFKRADLARYPENTLGWLFHRYLTDNDFDIELDPNLRRDPSWRPQTDLEYFELRSAQTHDFEHILGGVGFDFLGEVVPFWMRMENYFAHLSPELAGELAVVYSLLILPMQTRTMLHYPRAWTVVSRYIERGIALGRAAGPFFMARYEDLFELTVPEVRAKLGIPEVEEWDSSALSDYWSEGAQAASVKTAQIATARVLGAA